MNQRLHRLRDRQKALRAQNEKLLETADKEERDLTDDESAAFDETDKEAKVVDRAIEREQSLATHVPAASANDFGNDFLTVSDPSIGEPKLSLEDDPLKGFKTPREFFSSVMDASVPGGQADERLQFLSGRKNGFQATAGSDEQGTYADPYGGFLVPTGFLPSLLTRGVEGDPTAGRTTQVPMATPRVDIPARTDNTHTSSVSGGLVTYRRAETDVVTATRMTLEQVSLVAHPLMGLTYATEELLQDSVISFVALIEAGFRDEFAARLLREKLTGTGVGEMEGVIGCGCAVDVSAETGQGATTIVSENILKMRFRCWGYDNAIWMYNHNCGYELSQMSISTGLGVTPMWQPSLREDSPSTILGRPCFPTEFCSTLGTSGDIILVNWSQYLEGTYQPMQSAESMHVRFLENERAFRFTMRNDGRPWWRAALTPSAGDTLSPVVTLATRS